MEWEHKPGERRQRVWHRFHADTGSELTGEMIEKTREVNWALWTSIIKWVEASGERGKM